MKIAQTLYQLPALIGGDGFLLVCEFAEVGRANLAGQVLSILAESIEQGQQAIHRELRAAVHRHIDIYRTRKAHLHQRFTRSEGGVNLARDIGEIQRGVYCR